MESSSIKGKSETPLMKQYYAIKEKYVGAVVLFRVGDFYETFGEDAIIASKVLGITLTKRGNGSASEIELAGFPYHALDTYLPKLVRAGYRVAVCDQLEDPKLVKGIVKRGVTELVTPGVVFSDQVLAHNKNNYLASLYIQDSRLGVSFLDVSTGEFYTGVGNKDFIERIIQQFSPSEIIYPRPQKNVLQQLLGEGATNFGLDDWVYKIDFCYQKLNRHFGTQNLKGFGIEELIEGIISSGAILHYLETTEHHNVQHISKISRIEQEHFVWLDKYTIRNLELLQANHEGGQGLIDVLDRCLTPMGSRTLRKWICFPLKDIHGILRRQNLVEIFVQQGEIREQLTEWLKPVGDLERLVSKIAAKRVNPRELNQLKKALQSIAKIKERLSSSTSEELHIVSEKLFECALLAEKIESTLVSDPPLLTHQGGLIRSGVHAELDELRHISTSGKAYLLEITQREIERTGISSLKIQYNKVFGYYLEVTNTHKSKVPQDWIRKQTTTNGERYITEELKKYEETILTAQDKIFAIENQLYLDLVEYASEFVKAIQQTAQTLSEIDVLINFAMLALRNGYKKPEIHDQFTLDIKDGRHPVIEQNLPKGESYIPNDVFLDTESQQIIIITGPNMAGKSALLRQTALIVIMAQIGSFVPASAASIGIVDKIFTRVGASDNVSKGESTFMVEMTETASILNNLSDRSLVLMDEIGRGTSTYDGISIAWSIVEYLHQNPMAYRPKTLFATHYHELNVLADQLPRVKNYNVSVSDAGGKIIFMRKLKPGGSEHSFGIHVAQIAGMPISVVARANEVMHVLENDRSKSKKSARLQDLPKPMQMTIFGSSDPHVEALKAALKAIDINTLSPIEALLKLHELKKISGEV